MTIVTITLNPCIDKTFGVVAALAQDRPLPEAVRIGVAVGAAAVMTEGTELCRREDAERLHESVRRQEAAA